MVANVTQINCGTMINVDVSAKIQEKTYVRKRNTATCSSSNDRYAKSIIGNSVITCDEIIEMTKSFRTKTVQQKRKTGDL